MSKVNKARKIPPFGTVPRGAPMTKRLASKKPVVIGNLAQQSLNGNMAREHHYRTRIHNSASSRNSSPASSPPKKWTSLPIYYNQISQAELDRFEESAAELVAKMEHALDGEARIQNLKEIDTKFNFYDNTARLRVRFN